MQVAISLVVVEPVATELSLAVKLFGELVAEAAVLSIVSLVKSAEFVRLLHVSGH